MARMPLMLEICDELRRSQSLLSELCLHRSAVWAGELLEDIVEQEAQGPSRDVYLNAHLDVSFEPDAYFCYGRDLFEQMDYDRASETLMHSRSRHAPFLRFYSQYVSLQKQSAERCLDPKKFNAARLVEIGVLEQKVQEALEDDSSNAFLHYLLGMILIDEQQILDARLHLVQSVRLCQCHWGAWQALIETIDDRKNVEKLFPPGQWMIPFVRAAAFDFVNRCDRAMKEVQDLEKVFPRSRYLQELKGSLLHKLKNTEGAKICFENIQNRDPHRIDAVHVLSSVLSQSTTAVEDLSRLAATALETDAYRPETCCAIGNYYTQIKEHKRAIEYYERALKADKNFSTAWTLLGQRYHELEEYDKATNAFSRATELNPYDFRTWFGQGEIQKQLGSMAIAIQHFKKAVALKKDDDRVWIELGKLYLHEKIGKQDLAIKCFTRAAELGNTDGYATQQLGDIHHERGEYSRADACHRETIGKLSGNPQQNITTLIKSVSYVTTTCIGHRNFEEAQQLCDQLQSLGDDAAAAAEKLRRELDEAMNKTTPAGNDDQMMEDSPRSIEGQDLL